MTADRRTPALLLAVLYTVSGGLCLVTAFRPMHPETPVALLAVLAVIGVGGGAAIWVLRARLRGWVMHGAVALAGGLMALLAWQSATAVGIVGLGPAIIAVGLYAAHFFDLPAARAHAAGCGSSTSSPAHRPTAPGSRPVTSSSRRGGDRSPTRRASSGCSSPRRSVARCP